MSWINACHAFTVRDTPLSHPAWTISTPILPPPLPLPTVFTPLLKELGPASLLSWSQSPASPLPSLPQEEINWFCVWKPLSNELKAQTCHISLGPIRGRVSVKYRGMCNCIKGCVILKALSIFWTPRWCEPTEMLPYFTQSLMNLRLQSVSLNS